MSLSRVCSQSIIVQFDKNLTYIVQIYAYIK